MRFNRFIGIRGTVVCSAATLLLGAVGCGKLESGANSVVSVKYLPDAAAAPEASAEGTPAQGESTTAEAGGV